MIIKISIERAPLAPVEFVVTENSAATIAGTIWAVHTAEDLSLTGLVFSTSDFSEVLPGLVKIMETT